MLRLRPGQIFSFHGVRYQVEQAYENYVTGEKWTRILPQIYKTLKGAEAEAQRNRWVTMPDLHTRIDRSSARVIKIEGGA